MTPTINYDQMRTCDDPFGFDRWVPTRYYVPDFKVRIDDELNRLAQLPANWDRELAPALDRAIIAAARQLVAELPADIAPVPAVVPSADGNLQFEWNAGERSLELEIESPTTIRYLKWDSAAGIEEEGVFDIHDIARAKLLIRWFMRGVTDV